MEVVRSLTPDFETERQQFLEEMLVVAVAIPSVENPLHRVRGLFNEAAFKLYRQLPEYREVVDNYVADEKPGTTASYRLNKFFKAHQAMLLHEGIRDQWRYPETFVTASRWQQWLTETFSGQDNAENREILHSYLSRPLQINRRQRDKVPALGLTLLNQQYEQGERFVVHEYGSAADMVLKSLAIGAHDATTVVDHSGNVEIEQTAIFAGLTLSPPFSEGIGIESHPPKTEEDRHWIKACTLDPGDLDMYVDNGQIEEANFDLVMLSKPEKKITTVEGMFPELDPNGDRTLRENKADVAFLSHFLSQNPQEANTIIDTIAANYLHPEGRIFINEYATVDPENRTKLVISTKWYDELWQCRTIMRQPNGELYPIIEWDTARCKRARLTPHIGKLTTAFGNYS